ncbi:MAG: phosphonate ABC transporter, permease protein PhnE [Epulopiscium sp. Nele67-Bin004]|nr:MAG: phosphonate ABC transporter, permease protein PhnE [Epulopiscium sp. Nele67-Bin004]
MFTPKKITLANGKESQEPRSVMPFVIIAILIALYFSVEMTGFSMSVLLERGNEFFIYFGRMIPPNFGYISRIWNPLFDTIKMSLFGSVLGALLAIPIAVISASNIMKNKIVLNLARLFLSIVRTLPTLVIALIATYVLGIGTLAGTTAITIFTFAYIGKLLYEQIETVDMGAFEAMEAMGATKTQAFIAAIVPQVLPSYIANCLFNFEGNVRYAAILGYVGAGGIGQIINENIGWREYSNVGIILLVLFITVAIIEYVSHYIRKQLT